MRHLIFLVIYVSCVHASPQCRRTPGTGASCNAATEQVEEQEAALNDNIYLLQPRRNTIPGQALYLDELGESATPASVYVFAVVWGLLAAGSVFAYVYSLGHEFRQADVKTDTQDDDEPVLQRSLSDMHEKSQGNLQDSAMRRRRSFHEGETSREPKKWTTEDAIGTLGGGAFVVTMCCDLGPNGIVPLSHGLVNTGFGPAMLLLIGFYGCCVCTMWMIARTAFITGKLNFADQWSHLIGKRSSWIPLLVLIAVCFGNDLEYLSIVADCMSGALPAFGIPASRSLCAWLFAFFPTLPLCFLKDLSGLAPTSFFGLASVIFLVIAMLIRKFDGSYQPGGRYYADLPAASLPSVPQHHWFQAGLPSLVLMNALALGFLPHYNGCKYYRELKRHEPYRFLKFTALGMGSVGVLYIIAMFAGYQTFGANTQTVITENYSSNDLLFNIVRLCLGFSILTSFPIMFSGLREAVLQVLRDVADIDCSQVWKQDGLTVCMVIVIAFLTSIVNQSGVIVGLVGAICGIGLIFLLPCTLYAAALQVDAFEPSKKSHLLLTWLLRVLGVVLMVGGVYATLAF